ncbi:M61 glycyl aminopeptidase [Novosphingobium sp. PhB165]|uniref:M61 family metallopeptidase n=1 Tax=Novosphingobium sp. PhB165 TaxID=2485105 RepID=UPI00104F247A|nr:peptidase M61 [Novosphingobium sp. PhB165]TCM15413.1 M61 glycyl aminopeptidase [Novosphingobium sp. PhB165]
MTRPRSFRIALGAALLASTPLAAASTPETPDLTVTLAPLADPSGALTRMNVVIRFENPLHDGALAAIALTANTVETSAATMEGLVFTDAKGVIPVAVNDARQDGDNVDRKWTPQRPVEGPVTLAYRVAIDPHQPELAKPQYELRAADGGLSGSGKAFLVLPADDRLRNVSVHWDLSHAGAAARGISSLGAGDAVSSHPLRPAELADTYYMAGQIGSYSKGAFFGAWQGRFGFEAPELMSWAARLQGFYGTFFDQRPASFGVFARTNRLNPGSGIGLTDSFAFTFSDTTPITDLQSLLAHEMVHAWINSLSGSMDAPGGLNLSWFGEGLAVHYQRMLPWRAGLISQQAFLDDLNSTAARYYTNALIAMPNDRIADGFWKDTRIRVLPYDRGSLYFAKVDADIRHASQGKRSLDDVVRKMLAERRAGKPMDLALWKRLLGEELGAQGLADFDRMLAGETVLPPSDAFGPGFERVVKPLQRFDLGFDPLVLVSPDRVVKGLEPGSAAALAGLQNGDRILNRFPQDALQGKQDATLTLQVEREGRRFSLTYRPRGETVPAYQWQART